MNTVNRRGGDSKHTDDVKNSIHSLYLGGLKVLHYSLFYNFQNKFAYQAMLPEKDE